MDILIASLGESPVVVTAMYDILTKQQPQQIAISKVVVLHTQGEDELTPLAIDLIRESLQEECPVESEPLLLEDAEGKIAKDADSTSASYAFLHTLYRLLNSAQKAGDSVYLSLAGGRKNMSALMAILVPLFPCVKKLYHLIDQDESSEYRYHFKTIEDIVDLPDSERLVYFHPDLERLLLVDIPYGERQQVSAAFRTLLFTITEQELDELWDQDPQQAERIELYRRITLEQAAMPVLQIRLTESISDEYKKMRHGNEFRSRRFTTCFEQMKNPYRLKDKLHGTFSRGSLSFYFYKRNRTAERPFFHTEPQGIHFFPEAKVEKVIISGLAIEHDDGSYEPTGEELLHTFDPTERTVPLEAILPAGASAKTVSMAESALIVPLGTSPMIATQLYTLLAYQGSPIHKVVLVYPANSQDIRNSVALIEKAFEYEKQEQRIAQDVRCVKVTVPGYDDIDSRKACIAYERALEDAIDTVRGKYQIELALSGGRKGMAAFAMFVAQRKDIHYVYHTLITDKRLSQQVEKETAIQALRPMLVSDQERNDRLFLRAYEGNGPYTKFVLFKVPVLPANG